MSIKLTDTQLVMLSAARQRGDRCIAIPPNLKGGAAQKVATKLIAAGLAKEIKAKAGAAVWRRDDATGQTYALKLTAAGLKAIAVEEQDAPEAEVEIAPPAPEVAGAKAADPEGPAVNAEPVVVTAAPREGSKLATVVDLLRREGGATIAELAAATHWLPHTTRAALTGLRKRGYGIARRRAKDERASAYVIAYSSRVAHG